MKKESKKEPLNVRMPPALFARPMFRLALDPDKESETGLGYALIDVLAVLQQPPADGNRYAWPRYICLAYVARTDGGGHWSVVEIDTEDQHEDLSYCYTAVGGDHG